MTRRILAAIAGLLVLYALARLLGFFHVANVLGTALQYGVFALIVIFAPELRAMLLQFGGTRAPEKFQSMGRRDVADEIFDAVERLSRSGIGAIVVLERDLPLDDYCASGSSMEARVSADLLTTIFTPYSPLHDGAVIVRGDTIVAAGCILPLSQKAITDRSLGTRHRAALGLSDETDALVLVVSEERATVSVAEHGRLWRDLSPLDLRGLLAGRMPDGPPVAVVRAVP